MLFRVVFPAVAQRSRRNLVRVPANLRPFASTTPRNAHEDTQTEQLMARFRQTSIFQRMKQSPNVLVALQEMAECLQKQGMDFSSGNPPSTMQMMRLATNNEFRQKSAKFMEEMKNAGIDMNSAEIMAELMSLKRDPKS